MVTALPAQFSIPKSSPVPAEWSLPHDCQDRETTQAVDDFHFHAVLSLDLAGKAYAAQTLDEGTVLWSDPAQGQARQERLSPAV